MILLGVIALIFGAWLRNDLLLLVGLILCVVGLFALGTGHLAY